MKTQEPWYVLSTPVAQCHICGLRAYTTQRMQQFRGQDHILQRMTAADLGLPDGLRNYAQAVLNDERLMLFEFAKYGSLGGLLKKASIPTAPGSGQFQPLPNRVLAHVFHCRKSLLRCFDMSWGKIARLTCNSSTVLKSSRDVSQWRHPATETWPLTRPRSFTLILSLQMVRSNLLDACDICQLTGN